MTIHKSDACKTSFRPTPPTAQDTANTVTSANIRMALRAYRVLISLFRSFRNTAIELLTEPDDLLSMPHLRFLVGGHDQNSPVRVDNFIDQRLARIIEVGHWLI